MSIALGLRTKYFIIAVLVLTVAIMLQKYLYKYNLFPKLNAQKKGIYYNDDLVVEGKLYLAVLGSIYDVTTGKQHYGDGSPYNYFIGIIFAHN